MGALRPSAHKVLIWPKPAWHCLVNTLLTDDKVYRSACLTSRRIVHSVLHVLVLLVLGISAFVTLRKVSLSTL